MKRVFNTNISNFSDWELPETNEIMLTIERAVKKAASEAVQYQLESEDGRLDFPIIWGPESDGRGNPEVKDPLDVYIRLPLGESDYEGPEYIFNLREALKYHIKDCATDGSFAYGLQMLRDSLRKLADDIDDAISKSNGLDL